MKKLTYVVEQGQIHQEPNRSAINRLDQIDFFQEHPELFQGKSVLDLGCGDAYLRYSQEQLGHTSYFGVDKDPESNHDLLADFNSDHFKGFLEDKSFGLVLALQILPEDLSAIEKCLEQDGHFVHQSGTFTYAGKNVEEMIRRHFKIVGKQEYEIIVKEGEGETELNNVFVICCKKL